MAADRAETAAPLLIFIADELIVPCVPEKDVDFALTVPGDVWG